MNKHRDITLLHFTNGALDELKEKRELIYSQCNSAKKKLERITTQELKNDVLYYEHEIARITILIKCAECLTEKIKRNEIKNNILITGNEADKEYQGLPDLPEDYLTPEEREQQRQEFEELP